MLVAVPLLALGALAPTLPTDHPTARRSTDDTVTVRLRQSGFEPATVTVPRGGRLELVNDSSLLYVLVPSSRGLMGESRGADELGAPAAAVASGHSYTTARWNTPGTYHVSNSVVPDGVALRVEVEGR